MPPLTQVDMAATRAQNKYARDSPEPQPLFDCLFCVGIHEHLVLQTVKEKQLRFKAGEHEKVETEVEAEEDYQDIARAFAVNLLMYRSLAPPGKFVEEEEVIEEDEGYEMPNIFSIRRQMQEVCVT